MLTVEQYSLVFKKLGCGARLLWTLTLDSSPTFINCVSAITHLNSLCLSHLCMKW